MTTVRDESGKIAGRRSAIAERLKNIQKKWELPLYKFCFSGIINPLSTIWSHGLVRSACGPESNAEIRKVFAVREAETDVLKIEHMGP